MKRKCPYCNKKIGEDIIECPHCGEKLQESPRVKISIKEEQIGRTLLIEGKEQIKGKFEVYIPKDVEVGDIIEEQGVEFEIERIGKSYSGTKYFYNNSKDSDLEIMFKFLKGRINRRDFFWFFLMIFIILILVSIFLSWLMLIIKIEIIKKGLGFLLLIIILVFIYVGINLRAKRLHDFNYSGLLAFLPIPFLTFILLFIPGNRGDNKYGPKKISNIKVENTKEIENKIKNTEKDLNLLLKETINKTKNNKDLKRVDLSKVVFEIMKVGEKLHINEIIQRIIDGLNNHKFYIKPRKESSDNKIGTIISYLTNKKASYQKRIAKNFKQLGNNTFEMLRNINDKQIKEQKRYKNKLYGKNFIEKLFFEPLVRPIFIKNDINKSIFGRIFIFVYVLFFYGFLVFAIFVNIVEFHRHEIMNIIIPLGVLCFIKCGITAIFKLLKNIFLYIKNG